MKHNILSFLMLCCSVFAYGQKQRIVYAYDSSGNRTSRTIVLDSSQKTRKHVATSIEGITNTCGTYNVKIYPNPVVENLTISVCGEYSGHAAYSLYDSAGKKLTNGNITDDKTSVNMSSYAKGIYILNIVTGGEPYSWKILKK